MAYENEAQGISVGQVIGSAINPLNGYMYNPGLYSYSKGIKVPGIKNIVNAFKNKKWNRVGEIWNDKTIGKGSRIGKMMWGGVKTISPFGGGEWFGGEVKRNANIEALKKRVIYRQGKFDEINQHAINAKKNLIDYKNIRRDQRFFFGKNGKLLNDPNAYGFADNLEVMKNQSHYYFKEDFRRMDEIAEKVNFSGKQTGRNLHAERLAKLKSAKLALNTAKWGARAVKFGIFAGRAMSTVGLLSIAWDISKMVAEPLGRGIVSGINSTLSAYSERFNSDIGGKLSMGYLSQGAATERQRAIDAISRSHINGRSVFGSEASMMHG